MGVHTQRYTWGCTCNGMHGSAWAMVPVVDVTPISLCGGVSLQLIRLHGGVSLQLIRLHGGVSLQLIRLHRGVSLQLIM